MGLRSEETIWESETNFIYALICPQVIVARAWKDTAKGKT
jgi:hypothetical protein